MESRNIGTWMEKRTEQRARDQEKGGWGSGNGWPVKDVCLFLFVFVHDKC